MMMHESLGIASLEFERSKRIFFFGTLFPTFIIHLIFILSVLYTYFAGFPSSGNFSFTYNEGALLKAFIWELEFLAMFHVTILIPWLFNENNLDIFLFKASTNNTILIVGKMLSIIEQQVIFFLLFYSIGIITFILTTSISLSILEIVESIIAFLLGLFLVDLVVLAISLVVKRLLKSLQIGSTIISLYLFGLPLLIMTLLSFGFLSTNLAIFNIPIQLQELNNYLISNRTSLSLINLNLITIIIIEYVISLIIMKKVNLYYE